MEDTNWGTWEQLVLGGAVLRHGKQNWDAVAEELRSRTFYPYFFSPEACKAKYQELQERFAGCTVLLDELRKQRVAELKRELEKSEGSIGSLESKLESLKSEKNGDHNGNYAAGPTESPPSVGNISRVDYVPKETSAGSFTEETQTDSSPEFHIPATARTEIKAEEGEHVTSKENILKKRRGKRKRKDITSNKEVILDSLKDRDNIVVRSTEKAESTGYCDRDRAVRSSNEVTESDPVVESGDGDLLNLLDSIIESENLSSVFQRRTDSQRRGKYKKTIKRHVDLGTIRCGISDHSIASEKELYRDLLLLCNNIIVFYSKESREYKSAISLRAFATKFFRQKLRTTEPVLNKPKPILTKPKPKQKPKPKPNPTCNPPDKPKPISNPPEKPVYNLFEPPACIPPVKPRSARPGNPKVAKKLASNQESSPVIVESKAEAEAEAEPELPTKTKEEKVVKKKVDRPVKVGRSGGSKRVETPVNGKKRARKK